MGCGANIQKKSNSNGLGNAISVDLGGVFGQKKFLYAPSQLMVELRLDSLRTTLSPTPIPNPGFTNVYEVKFVWVGSVEVTTNLVLLS